MMPQDIALPFTMRVADNPRVIGVLVGQAAMRAAGAQAEFVAHNIAQASALNCSIILRAGEPPQYNKHRSPKSGLNLSKTSTQGFFKGALVEEERFARLVKNEKTGETTVLPHHDKDRAHLKYDVSDPEYQHVLQLDINMQDILRELAPGGDLQVIGYKDGLLRFEYKEGKGPPKDQFNGQFVIDLNQGLNLPQFYARPWDKPEHHEDWDAEKKIIKKPEALALLPQEVYERVFNQSFLLSYSEDKLEKPSELKAAKVFANRPRLSSEFLGVLADLSEHEPHKYHDIYEELKSVSDLNKILKILSEKGQEQVILDVYNKAGVIVAGDWDGLALGHPAAINPKYKQVWNTFDPINGAENALALMRDSQQYLNELKIKAQNTPPDKQTAMDKQILSIDKFKHIVNDFALARAGCVTVHEFVFQQVLNHAYRDEHNKNYGEEFDMSALQATMNSLLEAKAQGAEESVLQNMLRSKLEEHLKLSSKKLSSAVTEMLAQHLSQHLQIALNNNSKSYVVPHPQHDANVHNLFQHGFDMRNPYGSNLEGAWMMVNPDGGVIYGKTQEQLIEVMLTDDYLEQNHIDVNWGAQMDAGWDKIIERQIELNQSIPSRTVIAYAAYLKNNNIALTDEKSIVLIRKAVVECGEVSKLDPFFILKNAAEELIQSLDAKKEANAGLQSANNTASTLKKPALAAAASTSTHYIKPSLSRVGSERHGVVFMAAAADTMKGKLEPAQEADADLNDGLCKPQF